MYQVVEPPKPDRTSPPTVSRRALLSASAGFVAAGAGWVGAALRPGNTSAAVPAPAGQSVRQLAAFQMRQAAAQAYLDEREPLHQTNGDEARYPDKRASFAKTLPHNDNGEVDADRGSMRRAWRARRDWWCW